MLKHLLDRNPDAMRDPDRVRVVFANTGREMPETLAFVAACASHWDIRIHWIERQFGDTLQKGGHIGPKHPGFVEVSHNSASIDGAPFERLIERRRYLPNQQQRFCTTELKIRAAKAFLWKGLGWTRWTALTGIRFDEAERLRGKFDVDTKERWTNAWPLYSAGVIRSQVIEWWRGQNFDLELPTFNGKSVLGNCDGCFLKSEAFVAAFARDYPERHAWWERMEEKVNGMTRGDAGHFSKRYTRREMREMIERSGDWIFNDEAFLCQASDGDCTG